MLISILIPCHNGGEYVGRAIESALAQDWAEKEIIVHDDGSTDHSLEIIRGYGEAVQWTSAPKAGGNAARNRLLSQARGEWVQFLDADDYLMPAKISRQATLISDHVDAIYGSVTLEWWEEGVCRQREVSAPDPALDTVSHWLNWQLAQTGAVLWRASSLRRIGGWNESLPCCQDNELCLRALENGLRFVLSGDSDTIYRLWSSETVSRRTPERLIQVKTELIDRMIRWLETRGDLTPAMRVKAARVCFGLARQFFVFNPEAAIRYVRGRKSAGLYALDAACAPLSYRFIHRTAGFANAERVAAWRRRGKAK